MQKIVLTLYEHEQGNFNYFAKVFEYTGFKYKFEWLGLTQNFSKIDKQDLFSKMGHKGDGLKCPKTELIVY